MEMCHTTNMKKLLLILLFLVVVVGLGLGYLGVVPILSSVMGSNKPKDLGVTYSEQDLQQAQAKTKVQGETLTQADNPTGSGLVYEGTQSAELTLTSQEITALANSSRWKYNPLSQVQVRINEDGSAEASGYLDFQAARQYAVALGVTSQDIDAALEQYPIPTSKLPFYVKLTGGVSNNDIEMNVMNVKLANIPVPAGIIDTYAPEAARFVENTYLRQESIDIETLENQAGQVYLKGTLPEKEIVLTQ